MFKFLKLILIKKRSIIAANGKIDLIRQKGEVAPSSSFQLLKVGDVAKDN